MSDASEDTREMVFRLHRAFAKPLRVLYHDANHGNPGIHRDVLVDVRRLMEPDQPCWGDKPDGEWWE